MKKKLVKVRCKRCKKMFITDNFNKMIMRKYTAPLCKTCSEAYTKACYDAIINKMFEKTGDTYIDTDSIPEKWREINVKGYDSFVNMYPY